MNNDEWGNIGPDSIHDPKWARKKTKGQIEYIRKKSLEYYANNERSAEWQKKHLKATTKSNKKKRRYIMTPDGIMHGYMSTCKFYNITKGSLRDRMQYNPNDYFYCDKNGNREKHVKLSNTENFKKAAKTRYKPVMTPDGKFDSLRHACDHHGLTGATIREKLKSTKPIHDKWYYIK